MWKALSSLNPGSFNCERVLEVRGTIATVA